tara:strand:+ start:1160 stop:1765 length:606 start_codon:yes stop_codon:yes gene_type:complete
MRLAVKIVLITFFIFNFSQAAEYSGLSIGYTKHIAEDPHDSGGTTYYSDPEENGFVIGYFEGTKSGGSAFELESTYYSEVSQKLTSDVTVEVSTFTEMINLMATPGDNDFYGIFGGGIGIGVTIVDTSYKSGSTTFNGDNDNWNFAYQLILGFGGDNYEVVFKHSHFGEVEGGSGTTSAGGTYVADEFDNVYNSIVYKIKF